MHRLTADWWSADLLLRALWAILRLAKLWWSASTDTWVLRWIMAMWENNKTKQGHTGEGDESRMQMQRAWGGWMAPNQRLPHDPSLWFPRTFRLILPCSHLRSFIVCGCLWGGLSVAYPHHALCWWLSLTTSKTKLVRQFPSFRKFKIWNCRAVMGADSSPTHLWKAAAIEAESNRPFDQQKSFKAELHSVPPVALMLHTVVSHCEGVKCDFFSL